MSESFYNNNKAVKLLILDLNGVLCLKVNKDVQNNITENKKNVSDYHDVILRPFLKEFFEFIFLNYEVAIFSSTSFFNADKILKIILQEIGDISDGFRICDFRFKWFRDRTHLDPDYIDGNEEKPLKRHSTIKKLEDVYNFPYFNRLYTEQNTILCDDSQMKNRFNQRRNVIIVDKFNGDMNDTCLLNLIEAIPKKFDKLTDYHKFNNTVLNDYNTNIVEAFKFSLN
jgi:hypothetical protein